MRIPDEEKKKTENIPDIIEENVLRGVSGGSGGGIGDAADPTSRNPLLSSDDDSTAEQLIGWRSALDLF